MSSVELRELLVQRKEELVQPRVGDVSLKLDSPGTENLSAGQRSDVIRGIQEHRLTDPGLAEQQQRASVRPSPIEKHPDQLKLAIATDESPSCTGLRRLSVARYGRSGPLDHLTTRLPTSRKGDPRSP